MLRLQRLPSWQDVAVKVQGQPVAVVFSFRNICGYLCRYLEPEGDEHAGPVRKSQGADLGQLLEGAEAYDAGYYHRSRVNLLQEYGLPPADALSYQAS